MAKRIAPDIIGNKFGKLTVLSEGVTQEYVKSGYVSKRFFWNCLCDCGKQISAREDGLKNGRITSCGCYRTERIREAVTKHGMCGTPAHKIWISMIDRCYQPKDSSYPNYGGRGIIVCDRWLEPDGQGFINFFVDMGELPDGLSLDRIDPHGNYSAENCRWVDSSHQSFNQTLRVTNKSGKTGVNFNKKRGKWEARITKNYETMFLGSFDDIQSAVEVRREAEIKYYGYYLKGQDG